MKIRIGKNKIEIYSKINDYFVARLYSHNNYMTVMIRKQKSQKWEFWHDNHKNIITGKYKKLRY